MSDIAFIGTFQYDSTYSILLVPGTTWIEARFQRLLLSIDYASTACLVFELIPAVPPAITTEACLLLELLWYALIGTAWWSNKQVLTKEKPIITRTMLPL